MDICQLDPKLRFAAQLHYEMHYNKKTVKVSDCRIFYVTHGRAQLQIGDRQYTLQPGGLFYCCAGSIYQISTGDGFSLYSLNFDLAGRNNRRVQPISPEVESRKWDTMTVFADPVSDSSFLNSHLYLENAGEFSEIIQQIISDHSARDALGQETATVRLKLLLLQLHRLNHSPLPDKLLTVRNYLHQNYRKRISNKDLAALVGYHEYHLNRLFQNHFGVNLHQYLLMTRLSRAHELMLNTDLPLQDIAEQTGFVCYPHFSARFRQEYGCSPAQYRKNANASSESERL